MNNNSEKLRVLQVNKLYYPVTGGIERTVQQIAEGLNGKVDMKVLVCQRKGRTITEEVNGVWVRRAASLGVFASLPISFSFLWHLKRLSKDRDVIQFHMPFPLGDLGCLLSGYKGKVVIWWHSDIVRQKKMMKVYRPLMQAFLKRADCIVVATEGHINGSDYLKPYRDKCVIIPFGVERDILEDSTNWLSDKKKDADESNKKEVTFLFVGRLVYYKGCKVLLEAFEQVKNSRLVIVGDGYMKEELQHFAKEHNVEKKVDFMGKIDDNELMEQYKKCDVLILPSTVRSEAFGLVQIEAMAYGKPVINTDLPSGVPYVSKHKKTGLTVKPGDVNGLAEAMNWMIEKEDERIEMGRQARKTVEEKYTLKQMIEKIEAVYSNND